MHMLFLLFVLTTDTVQTIRVPVAAGESLSVTIQGAGQPVVLIPGLFGSTYGFRRVMTILSESGYRAVGVEPLGIGESTRPPDADYSLTAQADRISAVLDSLGIREAVLVGHAVGASLAMRVAYRRPALVRGIVSLEGGPGESATTDTFRRWMRLAPAARLIDGRRVMQRLLFREMKESSFDESWVTPEIVLAYTAGMARDYRATIKAYQGMARSEEPERLDEHLDVISCPVVLLVGDTKHGSGPSRDEISVLSHSLAAFAVDMVAHSGFFIQEEQPAIVASTIQEIVNGPSCGVAGDSGPSAPI